MNLYNVIHLDINAFREQVDNHFEVVPFLQKCVIKELKSSFPGCLEEDLTKLPSALMQIHQACNAQFVVIIDEWDAVFREDKQAETIQKDYISFLRGMIKDMPSKKFINRNMLGSQSLKYKNYALCTIWILIWQNVGMTAILFVK